MSSASASGRSPWERPEPAEIKTESSSDLEDTQVLPPYRPERIF
ncbi:MAG: hypothetical protein WDA07_04660 [Leucobacter sp.]